MLQARHRLESEKLNRKLKAILTNQVKVNRDIRATLKKCHANDGMAFISANMQQDKIPGLSTPFQHSDELKTIEMFKTLYGVS
ncbi:hypothetical protein BBJ29_007415 [Phytophthora kernoviae]|uniref:Uncharacterized protein n=1 Tax=Phytophthora kernoviae TaxID=325452 RepID=A0A3R7GKT9_9STRA|nr:hypothetical protein BBJ29_007415 [Phytophthora kernoviae]